MNILAINFNDSTLILGLLVVAAFIALMLIMLLFRVATLGIKKLTFDTHGGSIIKRKKIRKGKKVILSKFDKPKKANDTFICWCENITLTTETDGFIMPNSDKKIYAKWQSDIDNENARKEAERRKPNIKKEAVKQEKPEVKPTEQPKQQVKPQQAQQQTKPQQAKPQTKPQQAQQQANTYQYEFRKQDPKQTYAYSKYQQEQQDKLKKQENEDKKLKNYPKMKVISDELHFSIDSLKVLDEGNIEILYKKALKQKQDRERKEFQRKREAIAVERKTNEYKKPDEAKVEIKPKQEETKDSDYSKYNNLFSNVVEEEVVEVEEENVSNFDNNEKVIEETIEVVEETINPQVEEVTENPTTEPKTTSKTNEEKIKKMYKINENLNKLNSELAELNDILIKKIKG